MASGQLFAGVFAVGAVAVGLLAWLWAGSADAAEPPASGGADPDVGPSTDPDVGKGIDPDLPAPLLPVSPGFGLVPVDPDVGGTPDPDVGGGSSGGGGGGGGGGSSSGPSKPHPQIQVSETGLDFQSYNSSKVYTYIDATTFSLGSVLSQAVYQWLEGRPSFVLLVTENQPKNLVDGYYPWQGSQQLVEVLTAEAGY